MAMSAHFFTSLHPCFKESGTCGGVGKQELVRHSQSPLRPVFESHDSQYIDRKTRRSPSRWSHSLTLPRAPRTVRTAFYMTCFIFTGVSSIPYVRVLKYSQEYQNHVTFAPPRGGRPDGAGWFPRRVRTDGRVNLSGRGGARKVQVVHFRAVDAL